MKSAIAATATVASTSTSTVAQLEVKTVQIGTTTPVESKGGQKVG